MPPSGGFLHLKETEMKIEQYLDELIKREGGYVNNLFLLNTQYSLPKRQKLKQPISLSSSIFNH
ncbi:hypothetical protein FKN07_18790 [Proteus mirabilis]|nr:hypothetical protein FKN07_18790 [Proteus mirabilis]